MKNWPTIKVADEFDLQMGKTPARDNPTYWGGDQKWASIADIARSGMYLSDTKEAITQEAVSESGIKAVPQNTLVMSFKLSIGRTAITTSRMYTNEAIMAFLPHDAIAFDLHFLYHLFSNRNWSEGCNKAVKGVTLNKATLNAARIPKPCISEQRAVASTLDMICDLIAKCDEQLVHLDQLVKSRFVEMFGNVHDSVAIGQACVVMNGYAFKSAQYVSDGIRVIRIANVQQGYMEDPNPEFYPREKEGEIQKYMLQENDLLISLTGNVGRVALLPKEFLPAGLNQRVGCLRIRSGINLLKSYLYWALNNQTFECACIESSRGVAQKNMSSEWLKQYLIPIPPLALQREFAAFVEKVDKLAFAARRRRDVARQLYRAKIQEFFG